MGGRDRWRRLPWRLRYVHGANLMSALRKLSIRATHRHCTVSFGAGVYVGPGFHLYMPHFGSLVVGDGVSFRRGFVCEISGHGKVEIGAGTVFTDTALIQCTTSIAIGEHCAIGQSAQIVDGSHRFKDPTRLMTEQGFDFRPITIGRGAAIMSKCTIIADVGERAFIGANSVVTRDIPPFSLAVGAPARVIETFGPGEQPELAGPRSD